MITSPAPLARSMRSSKVCETGSPEVIRVRTTPARFEFSLTVTSRRSPAASRDWWLIGTATRTSRRSTSTKRPITSPGTTYSPACFRRSDTTPSKRARTFERAISSSICRIRASRIFMSWREVSRREIASSSWKADRFWVSRSFS